MLFVRTKSLLFLGICSTLLLFSCGLGIKSADSLPTISGASSSPNEDGSVTVTINGTGFVNGMTVVVNGVNCTDVNVLSSTQLTCVLPNGQIALVNIVVTTPSGGSSPPVDSYHTIFVTSSGYAGDFGGVSGVNGADAKCAAKAATGSKTSGLSGHWRAVLSDPTVNAKDHITFYANAKLKNTNGDTVVNLGSDLWSGGSLLNPIRYNENGGDSAKYGWTGSNSDGTRATAGGQDDSCGNWTQGSNTGNGIYGDPHLTNSSWINSGTDACGSQGGHYPLGFYCINSKD